MKIDYGDAISMEYQAESTRMAAGMLEGLADSHPATRYVLSEAVQALHQESIAWLQAASLSRALPALREAGRDIPTMEVGSKVAVPALEDAVARTEAKIGELLTPLLNKNGTPARRSP